MNLSRFLHSFKIGFLGLGHAIGTEQNMRVHLLIAVGVIAIASLLPLVAWEWIVVVLCIGLVLGAECMNTALERLADRVTREPDPLIMHAKDCGSAAVLVIALTTAVIGGVVFVPKLWAILGG